ncbi:sensor domain-containing diguanylate cyclase [Comamonas aquatilis]
MPVSKRIHRRTYPLRTSNMALGGLVVSVSLAQQPSPSMALWAFVIVSALAWPHIAFFHANRKRDHFQAEYVNRVIDALILGCWIPIMQWSILPSLSIVAICAADRHYIGLKKRWLQSLLALLIGMIGAHWWVQPTLNWAASFWVQLSLLPLILMHSVYASWSSKRMIRTLAKQNLQLQVLGRIDPLTTVYSRDYWWQKARTALRNHRAAHEATSLLIIDIDHFKQINDFYGHIVGDSVLQAVGLNIRQCLRSHDAAGRYGGDEFTVLCKNAGVEVAYAVALRIRDQVARIRIREHPELRVSASIGVAAAEARFTSVKDWIEAADGALYKAKQAGRDQVIHSRDMHTSASATLPQAHAAVEQRTSTPAIPFISKKDDVNDLFSQTEMR